MAIRERTGVSARELTTLNVGGLCKTVFDVNTETEIAGVLTDVPDAVCIGGGSNLLISQDGVSTPIVRIYSPRSEIHIERDTGCVTVNASAQWDALVQQTILDGLEGLECMSGIPGSVGGGIVQNVGAYGQEIADVFVSLTAFDRVALSLVTFTKDEVGFAYRNTRFKHDPQRRFIVTSVTLQLRKMPTSLPRYGDVTELLRKRHGEHDSFSLANIRQAVLDVRRSKGMLIDVGAPSAGSFFTNPEISHEHYDGISALPGVRAVKEFDDVVRVSAAALIAGAGFEKGLRYSGAGISEKHLLAIVNNDDATSDDIIALANIIRTRVYEQFKVELTPEPVMLGFSENPFPPLHQH